MRPADTTPALVSSVRPLEHSKLSADRQGQPACSGTPILLVDHDQIHATSLIGALSTRGLAVEFCHTVREAAMKLRAPHGEYAVVIVNISDASQPWLRLLHGLHEASFQSGTPIGALCLCVSTVKRDPLFELQIERTGARLVYER
jgi:hypothetical protein